MIIAMISQFSLRFTLTLIIPSSIIFFPQSVFILYSYIANSTRLISTKANIEHQVLFVSLLFYHILEQLAALTNLLH